MELYYQISVGTLSVNMNWHFAQCGSNYLPLKLVAISR